MPQSLRISILQTDTIWQNPAANRAKIEQHIPSKNNTDILLLPEMFTTGFSPQNTIYSESMSGATVEWMKKTAVNNNCAIAGSIIISENNTCFNRFIWAFPDKNVEYYDKRHLFSFAGETKLFSKGEKRKIIQYKGWRILPQICYDLRFSVWSRNLADYDIAIYTASWPKQRIEIWNSLLVARAIENQIFVIGINRVGIDGNNIKYNGHSQIIAPTGEIVNKAQTDNETLLNDTLNYDTLEQWQQKFPALKDADKFDIHP